MAVAHSSRDQPLDSELRAGVTIITIIIIVTIIITIIVIILAGGVMAVVLGEWGGSAACGRLSY
jgi:uncharacterized membrane protein